jgi:hypothetical protein
LYFYLASNSNTTNALVRGALHVNATFVLKAKWGNMRIIQGVAPWDAYLFSRIMSGGTTSVKPSVTSNNPMVSTNASGGGHTVEISIVYLKELKDKLDRMFVCQRARISKLNDSDSAEIYKANVTSVTADEVVCGEKKEGYYDCTILYVLPKSSVVYSFQTISL